MATGLQIRAPVRIVHFDGSLAVVGDIALTLGGWDLAPSALVLAGAVGAVGDVVPRRPFAFAQAGVLALAGAIGTVGEIDTTEATVQPFAIVQAAALALMGTQSISGDMESGGIAPTWISTVPTVQFTTGVSGSYNLIQHIANFDPARHRLTVPPGILPSGVTLNPLAGYEYNGLGPVATVSNVSIDIIDVSGVIKNIVRAAGPAIGGALSVTGNINIATVVTVPKNIVRVAGPSIGGVLSAAGNVAFAITGTDDWSARANAAGVIFVDRLDTLKTWKIGTNVTAPNPPANGMWYGKNDSTQTGYYMLDTVNKPAGAAGSAKFLVNNTTGADPGYLRCYFGATRDFGPGETVWCSFRMFGPGSFFLQPWANNVLDQTTGLKFAGLSVYQKYHEGHQIVPGDKFGDNNPHGFVNGVVYSEQPVAFSTSVDSTDLRWQSETNNGLNPLVGLNPDTGLAWTLYEQERAQWGPIYSAKKSHASLTGYRRGIGDWLSGMVRAYHNNWFTYTFRLDIGNWNTTSSRFRVWIAKDGEAYRKIKDHQNVNIGNPPTSSPSGGRYNGLWLTHYVTGRIPGGRRVGSRTNNITGLTIHAMGVTMPIGTGTLSWNRATQRLSFAAAGESAGPAVGYSAANGKLLRNVFSSGGGFMIVEFAPGQQPTGTGTITDTVTIVDGRADTFGNYAEVIVSTLPINATGGHPPIG